MSKQESSESAATPAAAPAPAAAPVATSESKSQSECKADQYKDANCPQTKKEQRKLLKKVHPDKYAKETDECKETAGEITRRITQCQYDENGELNTDAIFAELQQNAAEAEAAESANQAVKSNIYGTNRSTTASDTYLGWYVNNPDIVHPSESSEEQTLKKTMLAFRELVESPLNVNYPFPDLPNQIEDVPYGEFNPNEGNEDEIKQNFRAYMGAKRQKESAIRALAKDVRKAHDALAKKKPELAGRQGMIGMRIRWVRKNPEASKQKFNLRWSTGVLKRPFNNTPVNNHGVQPGSGPWYSGGKKKAKKTKKNKAKKKNKGKKTRVKWYGRKNVWVKFGKNKECNHKLRRCRTLKRTMVSKSTTKKSTTRKSTTRKSTTKKSTTRKSTTRSNSKKSKTSTKKKTRKIFQ